VLKEPRGADPNMVSMAAAHTCQRMGPLAKEHVDLLITVMHRYASEQYNQRYGGPATAQGIAEMKKQAAKAIKAIMIENVNLCRMQRSSALFGNRSPQACLADLMCDRRTAFILVW
jgi:hypothetical protein